MGDKPTIEDVAAIANSNAVRLTKVETQLSEIKAAIESSDNKIDAQFAYLFKLLGVVPPPPSGDDCFTQPTKIDGSIPGSNSDSNPGIVKNQGTFHPTPKFDFPKFDGTNPRDWVRKCEHYFLLHKIEDSQKVYLASVHFDDKVEPWFFDYQQGKTNIPWESFVMDLCVQFEDVAHDSHVDSFNKLSQTTTVEDYFDQFERLKTHMLAHNPNLTENYFVLSFIKGLKKEIRHPVQTCKPETTSRAFYLARMQQSYVTNQVQNPKTISKKRPPSTSHCSNSSQSVKPTLSIPSSMDKPTISSSKPFVAHPHTTIKTAPDTAPIRRSKLTPGQIKARRDKGLCYNCDEYYRPDHICKTPQQLICKNCAKVETTSQQ